MRNCVLFSTILRTRWRNAPRNKSELLKRVESGELRIDSRGSQVDNSVRLIIVENDSSRHVGSERVECIALSILQRHGGVIERFVYRRSALDPLFHPYYINYGANKVEMYYRLRALKCVLSLGR